MKKGPSDVWFAVNPCGLVLVGGYGATITYMDTVYGDEYKQAFTSKRHYSLAATTTYIQVYILDSSV